MKPWLIFLVLFILTVLGAGYFLYQGFFPPQGEVEAKEEKVEPIPLDALRTDMKSLTQGLEKNGELPIVLNPDESGRDNPFSGY